MGDGMRLHSTRCAAPADPAGTLEISLGSVALRFRMGSDPWWRGLGSPPSAPRKAPSSPSSFHSFWFAWYAMHPDTELHVP